MKSLLGFTLTCPPSPPLLRFISYRRNIRRPAAAVLRAKLNDDTDPFLKSPAYLRFQETHQPGKSPSFTLFSFHPTLAQDWPLLSFRRIELITLPAEPLFVDPYASCFLPSDAGMDSKRHPGSDHYCIATKFIDDKLLGTLKHMDGPKQAVLLTDGMDTRPYRLSWPASTMIFDISPETVFKKAAEQLQGAGARIPKGCLFFHVPLESPDIQQTLRLKGFSGNRPSIWAIQGLPVMTLASFEDVLLIVGSLAITGCLFLGELPTWLAEAEFGFKSSTKKWMEDLFMSNGFQVNEINYSELATSFGKEISPSAFKQNTLFVSEQLRFSDDQMEAWRREFRRIEEEGDEEGFED